MDIERAPRGEGGAVRNAFSTARGTAASHEFRMKNGKLRYIYTITLEGG